MLPVPVDLLWVYQLPPKVRMLVRLILGQLVTVNSNSGILTWTDCSDSQTDC